MSTNTYDSYRECSHCISAGKESQKVRLVYDELMHPKEFSRWVVDTFMKPYVDALQHWAWARGNHCFELHREIDRLQGTIDTYKKNAAEALEVKKLYNQLRYEKRLRELFDNSRILDKDDIDITDLVVRSKFPRIYLGESVSAHKYLIIRDGNNSIYPFIYEEDTVWRMANTWLPEDIRALTETERYVITEKGMVRYNG